MSSCSSKDNLPLFKDIQKEFLTWTERWVEEDDILKQLPVDISDLEPLLQSMSFLDIKSSEEMVAARQFIRGIYLTIECSHSGDVFYLIKPTVINECKCKSFTYETEWKDHTTPKIDNIRKELQEVFRSVVNCLFNMLNGVPITKEKCEQEEAAQSDKSYLYLRETDSSSPTSSEASSSETVTLDNEAQSDPESIESSEKTEETDYSADDSNITISESNVDEIAAEASKNVSEITTDFQLQETSSNESNTDTEDWAYGTAVTALESAYGTLTDALKFIKTKPAKDTFASVIERSESVVRCVTELLSSVKNSLHETKVSDQKLSIIQSKPEGDGEASTSAVEKEVSK